MWSIISLSLFVICVFCAEENISNNSTNPLFQSRIVGGSAANIVDHPHQLALILNGNFICGGSLIEWNWGLTAAHCCEGVNAAQLQIRAGSKYWDTLGILANILKIIINPKYIDNPGTMTHDTCLIKIENSLQPYVSKGFNIAKIGLATSIPSANTNVILAGWGTTSTSSGTPQQLRAATMQIIGKDTCSQSYYLDNSMFCAGKWQGGVDACFGDSGGGLRYAGKLIGIVSYGNGCADKFYPSVYCSIPVVRTWILNTINAN